MVSGPGFPPRTMTETVSARSSRIATTVRVPMSVQRQREWPLPLKARPMANSLCSMRPL